MYSNNKYIKVMTLHQKNKPSILQEDYKRSSYEIGTKVAFNRSGEVRVGTIVEVLKNDWKAERKGVGDKHWWSHQLEVVIVDQQDKKASVIRNNKSIAVIS